MPDWIREWVESIAGQPVTELEANEFLADFNDWLDRYFYTGDERKETM